MNKNQITETCRRLRRNQTDAEKELWFRIKNRQIKGLKFLRQHPFIYQNDQLGLSYFVADFYCSEKKIIIELDGSVHDHQKEYDIKRDAVLSEMNIQVFRFRNEEMTKILEFISSL